MMSCLTHEGRFGNPASRSHFYGWQAEEVVEIARRNVADLIGADTREIVWTSGATESNNLALKGVIESLCIQQKNFNDVHIVVSSIEHKCVLDVAGYLAKRGAAVTFVPPTAEGLIEVDAIKSALREDTKLVSVMHANNEVGVINPIKEIGALCRDRGVIFHSDAAQSCGKVAIDVADLNVDLMSVSAHKMYGPKGIGALFVRRHPNVNVVEQIHGGGHERGMRSGTLATHQIAGMGKAAELASSDLADTRIRALKDKFWQGVRSVKGLELNGSIEKSLPGILNLAFDGIDGETLLMSLSDLAVSSGSACMSATTAPSYVLTEMGCSRERAHGSLRFSFGRFTTEDEVDQAIEKVIRAVTSLNRVSA